MSLELLLSRFFLVVLLSSCVIGKSLSLKEKEILIKRGEKISSLLCQKSKFDLKDLDTSIKKSCQKLDKKDLLALKLYLKSKDDNLLKVAKIKPIPKDAKCIVCGMVVRLYPNWACVIGIGKKRFYFDGVKDMMRFYLKREKYHFDRSKISEILVQDFYTLKPIDAKKAFFVVGSNIKGPMGWDFIPFKELKYAKIFLNDHRGKKIIKFDEISLDMIQKVQKNEF